eukprot:gnl/Dysnectes_brevis/4206_a5558_723.p1 GENE.gnl/Dysnectes_brevis/4206_a5558_723~~gnl/Dysnectes_brevis/4206_a5558_723.p1  ORF type:complete len:230 (+),score=37.68 gnl/Dysnectes_brevis/4206_a5558_723:161-850(+)
MDKKKRICFNCSRGEKCTPDSGFKRFDHKLRFSYDVSSNQLDISDLKELPEVELLIFGAPTEPFTESDVNAISQFIEGGKSVLLLLPSSNEYKLSDALRTFLAEQGMAPRQDLVIASHFTKGYHHPHQAVLRRPILSGALQTRLTRQKQLAGEPESDITLILHKGRTLQVSPPALPLVSSGYACLPRGQPVLACRTIGEHLAVGSAEDQTQLLSSPSATSSDTIFILNE